MYDDFADAIEKMAAVGSAGQLYAQQKADSEFTDLMSSTDKKSVPKAFATGLAVGGVLPFALQTIPWLADHKAAVAQGEPIARQTYLAHLLKKKNVVDNMDVARTTAVAIDRYFQSPFTNEPAAMSLQNLRMMAAQETAVSGAAMSSLDETAPALAKGYNALLNATIEKETQLGRRLEVSERIKLMKAKGARPFIETPLTGLADSVLGHPSQKERKHIYNMAQELFEKDFGRKALSTNKLYFRAFKKHIGSAAKSAIPFAILGGITAAVGMHHKRKKGLALQAEAKRRGLR